MKQHRQSFLFYSLLFFLVSCGPVHKVTTEAPIEKAKPTIEAADGPYVFYKDNGAVRIIGADEYANPIDTTFASLPNDYPLQVVSHDKKHRFNVNIHPFEREEWKQEAPEKLLVFSDPHGDLDYLLNVLIGNNVINENYEWSYGKNGLMIIGDVFDRGDDVLPIFWLMYKLQQEASEAGGAVHFLLGNHEPMVLRNDLRYVTDKYNAIADHFNIKYADFFGPDTELGRWLAVSNTIQIIGDNLYVHAGLSENFYNGNYEIPYVNEQISKGLFLDREGRNNMSEHSEFLYSSSSKLKGGAGPLWYRGMIGRKGEDPQMGEDILNGLLNRYDVKRIIVGHTIFSEVSFFYEGKVVAVKVNTTENKARKSSRGVLIENGEVFVIGDNGKTDK